MSADATHGHTPSWKPHTLHHDPARHAPSPGCARCVDRDLCGTLSTGTGLFDCSIHCCGKPNACTWVCRRNLQFRQQIQEIGGLSFDRVILARTPAAAALPGYVPQLYHGSLREAPLAAPAVAIKLAQLFDKRTGAPLVASRADLDQRFMLAPGTTVLVTGVDKDPVIERWWQIGKGARSSVIAHLAELQVAIATTPNFSLSLNWPRIGDLAAMKRILLSADEMMAGGLPTALHVNGRTPKDFERWTALVRRNDAVTHLAYEFTTGAAHGERREQHIRWLCELAASVARPLHLIVFGDCRVVVPLRRAFTGVTWIDTTSFMKTVHRRRAQRVGNGKLLWSATPTVPGSPLHDLLTHNVEESRAHFAMRTAA